MTAAFDEPTIPQKTYCLELHREHILLETEIVKLQNLNDLSLQESLLEQLRDKWRHLAADLQSQHFTRDSISADIRQVKANKAELKKILWREQNRAQLEWEDNYNIDLPDGIYSHPKSDTDPTLVIYQVKKALHGSGRKVARQLTITTQTQTAAEFPKYDPHPEEWFLLPSGDSQPPVMVWTKTITKGKWIYKGLASKYVTLANKMSIEDAKEWGKLYSICARCGANLVDPLSIELGMGPTCRGAKNWQ